MTVSLDTMRTETAAGGRAVAAISSDVTRALRRADVSVRARRALARRTPVSG